MAKKSISEKRAERERRENQTLRRVFDVFLMGLAAECYLFIVYRYYAVGNITSQLRWYDILRCGSYVGVALALAGCVLFFLSRKRTDKTGRRMGLAALWCLGIGVFLALSGWVMTRFFGYPMAVTSLCILVPILTVLGVLYLMFQHECFLCTVALGGALFTVWARGATAASAGWRAPVIAGAVFGAVLLAAAAALTRKAQQNGGKLWGFRFCSPACDYRVVYAALGAGFLCVLAALAAPAMAYYVMWAAGILLFAELAYYTTQLM